MQTDYSEEPEPIDIHRYDRRLATQLQALTKDRQILPENRDRIREFVEAARTGRIGSPGFNGRRMVRGRGLSVGRCQKLVWMLQRFAREIPMPFENIDVETMERFVFGIEDGRVEKLQSWRNSSRYTPETVRDFRMIIRQFYRWLLMHDQQRFEELTGWFDMRKRAPALRTFGLKEARRMAASTGSLQGRALIMLLFDGGFRAGELLNVRLSDLDFQKDSDGGLTCFVRIRVSKTRARTISLPLATEEVLGWLHEHPAVKSVDEHGIIAMDNPHATLITWTYNTCRKNLADQGRKVLNERLYCHRFRHASATYYARLLTPYQLCSRYGWSMGSQAVDRYVDHSGVLAAETADLVRDRTRDQARFVVSTRKSVESFVDKLRKNPDLCDALRSVIEGG